MDASGTGFNAAGTPAVIPGSQFTIPQNHVGVIRSVTLSLNNMVATTAIAWTLFMDGTPVAGWSNLTLFPRVAGYAAVAFGPGETFIPITEGAPLEWRVNVTDANTYQAGVSYHGWSYPKRTADGFAGLYNF